MQCSHFDAGRCGSCTLIKTPYDRQVADKHAHVADLLAGHDLSWLPAVTSAQTGFRNKAKMVVSGTLEEPILGLLDPGLGGVDLRDCPLYSTEMQNLLTQVRDFIIRVKIMPYDLQTRAGELKYVLVTESPDGQYMVRLVSRSQEPVTRIKKYLLQFLEQNPQVRVMTVNVQPHHKAILEGELEIILTAQETLPMAMPLRAAEPGVTLHLRPQSFFQTNTAVATQMYRQAQDWVAQKSPATVWDLFCGVGGFALSVAPHAANVTGIEISPSAIESAQFSASELGYGHVSFGAGDATAFSVGAGDSGPGETSQGQSRNGDLDAVAHPDLIIVNPPRRGIGPELATWLERSGIDTVIYSSCNAKSLAQDLAAMPSLRPVSGRLLDMFPNTAHYEVMVLLERAQ
ncbi:methyltransferase domain-containing protein [Jonesiaceae bacterium BS-20]|uniref:Methyltransferase domain-containing protein n=1 Tax=Jonesiaceae bacterium BS-20 TaxID=3120821 RepID=A0AAU7DUJ9_9MICO